jgi:dienelactone hydrolase
MPRTILPRNHWLFRNSRGRMALGAGLGTPLLCLLGWWGSDYVATRPDESFVVPAVIGGQTRSIRVDRFAPSSTLGNCSRGSAVVLLHGIEGADRNQRSRFRQARLLSRQGHQVFVVRYFDSVDYQDLWLLTPERRIDLSVIEDHCRRDAGHWVAAVGETLRAIAARPDVDARRIALDGYSLGGFVALATAELALADDELPDVRAVVVNWGARFADTDFAAGYPPTLFIHGQKDEVVSLTSAEATTAALRAAGIRAQLFVVPDAGHPARSLEADEATEQFLRDELCPPEKAGLVELAGRGVLSLNWPQDPRFLAPGIPRF